jgi:hypothetical protein
MIRYPNITGKNDAQKLDQMKSYLHQLADELNYQLDKTGNIGSGYSSSTVNAGTVAKPVKKDDAISNFNEIKGLIIKSADIVDAYSEEISKTLNGQYVAVSDFGKYKKETQAQITESSDKIEVTLKKQEEIETNLNDPESEFRREISSEIQQTADSINLKVVNDTEGKMAGIQLTVGEKDSGQIDMTGLVTFSNLETADGVTKINGGNIISNTLTADMITAGVLKSKDGEKIVIDLDNGNVHAVGTFETEWESTDGSSVHTAVSPSGLHIQKGEGTGALHSKFLFHEAYVQKHNTDFTKAEAYMRPYGDPYDAGKSLMGLKHGDVASVENQVGETMLGTAYAQTVYSRGSKTLEVGVNDARTFISGLDAPQYNKDAVNKAYVDDNFLSGSSIRTEDWNTAINNGFYFGITNAPDESWWYGYVVRDGADPNRVTQTVFRYGIICTRTGTISNMGLWEWANPPMVSGRE